MVPTSRLVHHRHPHLGSRPLLQAAFQSAPKVVDGAQIPTRVFEDFRKTKIVEPSRAIANLELSERSMPSIPLAGGLTILMSVFVLSGFCPRIFQVAH